MKTNIIFFVLNFKFWRFLFNVKSEDNQTVVMKHLKETGKNVTVQTILIENEVSESNYTIADPGQYE